jgi:hypothetical protein
VCVVCEVVVEMQSVRKDSFKSEILRVLCSSYSNTSITKSTLTHDPNNPSKISAKTATSTCQNAKTSKLPLCCKKMARR